MAKNFDPNANPEKNPSLKARWEARAAEEDKKSLDNLNKSLTKLVKALTPEKNKPEDKPANLNFSGLSKVSSLAGRTANSLLMASSPAGYLAGSAINKVYSMLREVKDVRGNSPKQLLEKPNTDSTLLSKPLAQKLEAYLDFQGGNLKQRAKFEKYYANYLEKSDKANKETQKKVQDDNKKSLSELTKLTNLIKPMGLAVLGIGATALLGVALLRRFFGGKSEVVELSDKDVRNWTHAAPTEGKQNLFGTRVSSAFGSLRVGSGSTFQDNVSLETAKKGGARPHLGMDVAYTRKYDKTGKPIAIPVYSPVDGKVVAAVSDQTNSNTGFGNYVKIQEKAMSGNTNVTYVTLAHLETVTVKVGTEVKKGDKVGTAGSTGASTGLHLHVQREIQTADGHTIYTDPADMYTNWYGDVASVSALSSDQISAIKSGDVRSYRNRRIASITESQLNRLKGVSSVSKNDTKISDRERVAVEKEQRDREFERKRQEAASKPPQIVIQQPTSNPEKTPPPMAFASMNADLEALSRNSKGVSTNY